MNSISGDSMEESDDILVNGLDTLTCCYMCLCGMVYEDKSSYVR
jgi:hypothetical protein